MAMETSLKYAIASVKRNIYKYSELENLLDACYEYCLREDEVHQLVKSYNRYVEKHMCGTVSTVDVESVLRNL